MAVGNKNEGIPHTIKDSQWCPSPASPIKEVALRKGHVKIEIGFEKTMQDKLMNLLCQNEDLRDLKGVKRKLAEHKLKVTPGTRPTCQKLQPLRGERKEAASTEIAKLREAGFIQPVHYLKLLANISWSERPTQGAACASIFPTSTPHAQKATTWYH